MEYHVAASAVVSGALYAFFQSWALAGSALAMGVLVDVDHVFDFFMEKGFRPGLEGFFRTCYQRRLRHAFLLFHAWEWLIVLVALAWRSGWNPWITGAAAGLTHHMVFDQVRNRPSLYGYSLAWRLWKRFDCASAFPEWH